MSQIVPPFGSLEVTIPAGEKIALACRGRLAAAEKTNLVNYPDIVAGNDPDLAVDNSEVVSSAYSSGAVLLLDNQSPYPAYAEVGAAPRAKDWLRSPNGPSDAPTALNSTGTLTSAMILGGIVTSTTGAAVTATLDTGAVMDAASEWEIGEAFRWQVINTGGANAFTVTAAASGHTVVGAGAVAASSSGDFLTRKTAADTFITYRIG